MKSKYLFPIAMVLVLVAGALAQYTLMDTVVGFNQKNWPQGNFGEQISQLVSARDAGVLTDKEFRLLRSMLIDAMGH